MQDPCRHSSEDFVTKRQMTFQWNLNHASHHIPFAPAARPQTPAVARSAAVARCGCAPPCWTCTTVDGVAVESETGDDEEEWRSLWGGWGWVQCELPFTISKLFIFLLKNMRNGTNWKRKNLAVMYQYWNIYSRVPHILSTIWRKSFTLIYILMQEPQSRCTLGTDEQRFKEACTHHVCVSHHTHYRSLLFLLNNFTIRKL